MREELGVEVGVKESLRLHLWSKFKWASHVERTGDEKLAKRADAQKVEEKEARKTGLR